MTQEDRELLLKDLSARLPYDVIVQIRILESNEVIDEEFDYMWLGILYSENPHHIIKPYLRPMSSMTEEEKAEFELLGWRVDELDNNHPWAHGSVDDTKGVDFLNSHHFDYRGLIEKGLAIEVTEENDPYV